MPIAAPVWLTHPVVPLLHARTESSRRNGGPGPYPGASSAPFRWGALAVGSGPLCALLGGDSGSFGGARGLGLFGGGCGLCLRGLSALGLGSAPGLRLLGGGCALGLGSAPGLRLLGGGCALGLGSAPGLRLL